MISVRKLHSKLGDHINKGSHITNIATIDSDSVVISLTNNDNKPLITVNLTNDKGRIHLGDHVKTLQNSRFLCNSSTFVDGGLHSHDKDIKDIKDIKYVNKIKISQDCPIQENDLIVIPKHKFELEDITFDGNHNLKKAVIEAISDKNPKICTHKDCYHLVGFIELHEFNLVVQFICNHSENRKQKKIFIMKSTLIGKKLLGMSVFGVIDFMGLCKTYKLSNSSKNSLITSVTTNGKDEIYLVSSYGKHGHVWAIPYFFGLNYLGAPILLTKLDDSPRGITVVSHNDNEQLLVICDNIEKEKLVYYSISKKV